MNLELQEVVCEKCEKQVLPEDGKVVSRLVSKQSWGSPAEYEEQFVCDECLSNDRFVSENEDYLRARAAGWDD